MSSAVETIEPTSSNWKTVRLRDVCQFKPPKSISRKALDEDSLVSFVPMGDLSELTKHFEARSTCKFGEVVKGYTYFADGDVLCAKITPCFENGKLGIARNLENGVGFGSSEFVVMRSSGEILPEFLYYYLSRDAFRESGKAVMSGAVGHKRVPKEYFENLEIPLPPLDDQKRIVAVLDQAFAALDRARDHAEMSRADAIELQATSIEAELSSNELGNKEVIGPYVDLLTGFAFKSKGYSDDPSDIRLIRGDNIVQGDFRWNGVKYWPIDDRDAYEKYELALNDVLIAMDRTWVSAGIKYAVVDEDALPSLLVQRVARLRTSEYLNPRFLAYWIGSRLFEKYVLSTQTGLGVPHVSGKQLEAFPIRVPTQPVQEKVVHALDKIVKRTETIIAAYEVKLAHIAELRQSLLHRAFAGELA